MKLSSKAHYGLQACQILAGRYGDAVSATELEEKIGVSGKYLEKIMRILTQNSIVTARRGASGGYMLVRPPERTTVGEITRALEDDMRARALRFLGLRQMRMQVGQGVAQAVREDERVSGLRYA